MTRFKDLSIWLKIAAIAGLTEAALFAIGFVIGFYNGFVGAL